MMLFDTTDPLGVADREESAVAVLYSVPAINDDADWKGVTVPANWSSRPAGKRGGVAGVAKGANMSVLDNADPNRVAGSSSRTGRTVTADE